MNLQINGGWKYKYEELPPIKSEDDIDGYIKSAQKMFPKWKRGIPVRVWDSGRMYDDQGREVEFDSPTATQNWEFEQIRRCIHGHDGMSGKMYFYYNFCSIKNISGGFIRPQFRVSDAVWFHLLESCEVGRYNQGRGVICVKRRRGGFSWKQASDSIHDSLIKPGFRVGMTSKDEKAAKDLMKKVYQMYERLPPFLKHPFSSKTQEHISFARKTEDELGQKTLSGNESEIYCHAPTDSCFEGEQIGKMVIDEAGKIPNLETIWSMGEPTLMEETERVGIPVLFGTAGEQTKAGVGQKVFWKNNDSFNFERFFFPGWAGLKTKKDGNDDIRASLDWILGEREKLRKLDDNKRLLEFVQQYPLYSDEAFLTKGGVGIGNPIKINEQLAKLEESPHRKIIGKFRWGNDNEDLVVFEPNSVHDMSGQCIVYEEPQEGTGYISGCDPADHDFVQSGASKLSLYIVKRQRGSHPPKIVFSYTDRPDRVNDYYDQSVMALLFYGNVKVLIENNRWGMIKYYQDNGYGHLLKEEPIPKQKMVKVRSKQVGVRATVSSIKEMERCLNHYTDDYCDLIPDPDLLLEFGVYGDENTDRVMAFGWTLVALEDDYVSVEQQQRVVSALPTFKMKKINGKVVRVRN